MMKIAGFYKEEADLSQFYKIFAAIAIFLSCLGLYGLASFMAVQRVKEVGIRKVLGATAANIIYLFSKEFVVLIGIAFVICRHPLPGILYTNGCSIMSTVSPSADGSLSAGGVMAVLIALTTISFQAFRAATVNPVKNLRSE